MFLTGDFAYKVKKPVRFDYLDFSTLERRRYFCQRELTLNRRLAPQLYLDVVPVGGTPEAPRFGDSPAFDYAVRMRQFPDETRLDRVLAAGRFGDDLADRLGEMLAAQHEAAAVAPAERGYGSVGSIVAPLIDNYRELKARGGAFESRLADQCRHDIAQVRRLRPVLRERRRLGRIRDCHGDLHLANLIVYGDELVPFDRLEFDPALRWIDVFNEVAFPLTDLVARGRTDLAFGFLNRYLERSGDYAGLAVVPLYSAYKALIRAKITAVAAPRNSPGVDDWLASARRLSQPRAQRLILMHGLTCSGKSSVASGLMRALPAIRLRSDVERKRRAGLNADESSASGVGAGLYSARQSAETYDALAALAQSTLASGYDAIVDATFLNATERGRFLELADRVGVTATIVHCDAPEATLRERLAARAGEPGNVSEADDSVLAWQLERVQPLSAGERAVTVRCDTSGHVDLEALIDQLTR